MNRQLLEILRSLRDIEGVLGSFIWLADGRLLASDMPQRCPPAMLETVAARVQRLSEAFASADRPFESTTLAFAQYRLHVRSDEGAFIATILGSNVNVSALNMAAALALRDLSAALLQPIPLEPSSTRDSGVPEASDGARVYRGQRLPS